MKKERYSSVWLNDVGRNGSNASFLLISLMNRAYARWPVPYVLRDEAHRAASYICSTTSARSSRWIFWPKSQMSLFTEGNGPVSDNEIFSFLKKI